MNAADHPMLGRDHLTPPTRTALHLPLDERIAFTRRDRWIDYPAVTEAMDRLRDLLTEPDQNRRHSLFIAGRPNNGKTSLLKRFRAENPYVSLANGKCEGPVVAMSMPKEADEAQFWSSLLRGLNIPHRSSSATKFLRESAEEVLEEQNARVLLIDDVHDGFRGNANRQRLVLALIRKLSNDLGLPLIATGVKEAVTALQTDKQVTTRFDPILLPPWVRGKPLANLLTDFESSIPLPEPSSLASQELGPIVLRHCGGTIGGIWHLLKLAAVMAMREGAPRMGAAHLEAAVKLAPPDWATLGERL